jgi:hypothetical protein
MNPKGEVMKKILLNCLIIFGVIGCATNEPKETPLEVKPKDTYCNPSDAKKLIGQSVPSEAELKKITNAGVVRISRKGEPVRSNLVHDRLSIVIDNESKIIYSNCS